MITFPCPHCSSALRADEAPPDGKVRCPACGEEALVPAQGETSASPAGYAILFELGRGDASVVYAVRRQAPSRVVALKFFVGGAAERARFHSEAEATARVRHPGVVQLYEVGEHDGRPFMALEYCPEGGLDRKLSGTPMPPRDAAALVRQLAEAVQAAHDAGVVHGDLRPANVLLAEDGTPRVTGFGLARKLDEHARQAGAVMARLSSTSPEQARGGETGPSSDVYALGAILYECLTGRPPFRAATAQDTLAQVVGNEPAPPGLLNPAVPPDLEAVCLKCLRKEPARRYASARELADELGRFAGGEPTATRPPGAAARWLRRNPAAAALAALALVALAGGAAVATLLALDARAQQAKALQAERKAAGAQGAEPTGKPAEDDARAEQARKALLEEVKRAREQQQQSALLLEEYEAGLAAALLRPIGRSPPRYDAWGHDVAPLEPVEAEAFLALGRSRSDRLRLRLLEAALGDPREAERAGRRAGWVIQGVVGLDRGRRREVEALVTGGQAEARTPELALACARLGMEADVNDPRWAKQAAEAVVAAMGRTTDAGALNSLAQSLKVLSERLDREDAFRLGGKAAEALVAAMSKAADLTALSELALGLGAVSDGLPARLAAEHAGRAVAALAAPSGKETPPARQSLAAALATVSERLNAAEATKAALALASAMRDVTDPERLALLAKALGPACERAPEERAATFAGKAAEELIEVLGKKSDPTAQGVLMQGLEAVAPWLDAKVAAQAVGAIFAASKTATPAGLAALARALKPLSGRLGVKEGATERAKMAELLVAAIGKTTDGAGLDALAGGLEAVGEGLDDKQRAKAAEALVARLTKSEDVEVMSPLARAVAAVGGRLDAREANRAAEAIVGQFGKDRRAGELAALAEGLKGVAGRLEAADADRAAEAIVAALDGNAAALEARIQGLRPVLGRVEAKQAAARAATAAEAVVAILEKNAESDTLFYLAYALQAVGDRLDAKQADRAAEVVVAAIPKTRSADAALALMQALEVLSGRLDAGRSAKHAAGAAAALAGAMGDATQPDVLARALEAAVRRLDAKQASGHAGKAAKVIVAALSKSADAEALNSQGQALKAVGGRLDAREAGKAAEAVVAAMSRTKDTEALGSLAQALGAVSGNLGDGERDRALETLILVMAQATDPRVPSAVGGALRAAGDALPTADLVALLSHPLCAGAAQRALLDVLGSRLKRPFRNTWHFLDWAEANGVDHAIPALAAGAK